VRAQVVVDASGQSSLIMSRLVCEYYNGFSFGRFVRKYPHFKGHLTDLLIGDLFKDSVDEVIEPMNAIRQEMASDRQPAVPARDSFAKQ
jgi:hypothetical protein